MRAGRGDSCKALPQDEFPTGTETSFVYPEPVIFDVPKFVEDGESAAILAAIPPRERFHHLGFGAAVLSITSGTFIDEDKLAEILEHNRGRPIPPVIEAYCKALAGKQIKKRRGQKGASDHDRRGLEIAESDFRRFRSWLRKRKKRYNELCTWSYARGAEWYSPSPYDMAVGMVWRKWYPEMTFETVKKLLSQQGTGKRPFGPKPAEFA